MQKCPIARPQLRTTLKVNEHFPVDFVAWACTELGIWTGSFSVYRNDLAGCYEPLEPAQLGIHNIVNVLGMEGIRYFGWTPGAIGSECSGCSGILTGVLWALRDDVATLQRPLDIVIGPGDIPDEIGDNVLLYGNCQAKNKNRGVWLSGCPPSATRAYTSIGKMTLSRITYTRALIKRLFKGYKVKPLPQWEHYKQITNP